MGGEKKRKKKGEGREGGGRGPPQSWLTPFYRIVVISTL